MRLVFFLVLFSYRVGHISVQIDKAHDGREQNWDGNPIRAKDRGPRTFPDGMGWKMGVGQDWKYNLNMEI